MKSLFAKCLSYVIRFGLSLRYRIHVKNSKELDKLKNSKRGCLILPNHPAEVDPILMISHLWGRFKPHPLVVEKFYYYSGAKFFMEMIGAIPIPDFEVSVNPWKIKKGDIAYQTILDCLKKGENILVYPSGYLKRSGHEKIGGSSLISRLMSDYNDFDIVLVRMDGLWGSMFSRALSGMIPDFWSLIVKGIKILFKNFIFFTPRRHIKVEFLVNPSDLPVHADKKEINTYLEKFYNQYETKEGKIVTEEPVNLVSYRFYRKKVAEVAFDPKRQSLFPDDIVVPLDVKEKINAYLKTIIDKESADLKETAHLSFDLGLDSLDVANVYAFLSKEFDLQVKIEPGELKLVRDLYALAVKCKEKGKNPFKEEVKKSVWSSEPPRPMPAVLDESNVVIAFLKAADRMKGYVLGADAVSLEMTYDRFKMAVLILTHKIGALEGKYIGIMLPSSIGVYIVVLATLMAKKIPVMLNWTAGLRSLEHAVDLLDMKAIISSRRFLDRVQNLDLGSLESSIVLMEDLRAKISLKDKIRGAITARLGHKALISKFKLDEVDPKSPAAVLFTSGTEAYPKAVPLSHYNILSNQTANLRAVTLLPTDIMYGVLPAFHSFGFNPVGLLPILAGVKVFYAPDPTDTAQMVSDVSHYKLTIFACAPSFFKNVIRVAKENDLRSVRLFVAGAEKSPENLGATLIEMGAPGAEFIEGYGITECSPGIASTRPQMGFKGVGIPFPGITIKTIHPETEQVLKQGETGEICIHGPSVFEGYIGPGKDKTFIDIEGKRYYRSADLGYIDEKGALVLQGRLKRFVKIGGEMISLASIEHELICKMMQQHANINPNEASFVLSVVEKEGLKPKIGLMTTCKMDKDQVNELLKDSGFGSIVKIAKVNVVDKIPMTGTGKIDYRSINAKFAEELA